MNKPSSAQCHVCGAGPFILCYLYTHLRFVHNCAEDEIKEVQKAIKRAKYRVNPQYQCDICEKIYYSDGGLRKHKRIIHEKDSSIPSTSAEPDYSRARAPSVHCPECETVFVSSVELAVHCENNHANNTLDFTMFDIHFNNWRSFEVWKERKEHETFTKLVRRTTRRSGKGTTHMYACQYSARASGKKDSGREKKRRKKFIRTSKHCPCFAKVTQNLDESVDVLACFGHLGHTVSSADLPLSHDDEMFVRSLLIAGFSPKEIVTKLRRSRWNEGTPAEKQPRLCFLATRDVKNIAARHGLIVSGSSADLDVLPYTCDEVYQDDEEEVDVYHELSDNEVYVT